MSLKPVSGKTTVVVHPLVLLSVVDHYNRACKQTRHRAVGVLLGSWKKGNVLDVANSFAGSLPFPLSQFFKFSFSKFLSKKMRKTQMFGFWIMTILQVCLRCFAK